MNVNRSHDVIFKQHLSIIKSLDDELRFYVPFNRISIISGQWKGKYERPCAMKRRLASERILPSACFEPETPWSDFESAKSSAMRSHLVVGRRMDGGADITSRLCFASLIILYRIGDINDIKTTKALSKISSVLWWIMHQSFVSPHTHTHKRRIAGTTAFHPSQPWDLLRRIALLFIIINPTGYICIILLARLLRNSKGQCLAH